MSLGSRVNRECIYVPLRDVLRGYVHLTLARVNTYPDSLGLV